MKHKTEIRTTLARIAVNWNDFSYSVISSFISKRSEARFNAHPEKLEVVMIVFN